jgi:hypothetical protein
MYWPIIPWVCLPLTYSVSHYYMFYCLGKRRQGMNTLNCMFSGTGQHKDSHPVGIGGDVLKAVYTALPARRSCLVKGGYAIYPYHMLDYITWPCQCATSHTLAEKRGFYISLLHHACLGIDLSPFDV